MSWVDIIKTVAEATNGGADIAKHLGDFGGTAVGAVQKGANLLATGHGELHESVPKWMAEQVTNALKHFAGGSKAIGDLSSTQGYLNTIKDNLAGGLTNLGWGAEGVGAAALASRVIPAGWRSLKKDVTRTVLKEAITTNMFKPPTTTQRLAGALDAVLGWIPGVRELIQNMAKAGATKTGFNVTSVGPQLQQYTGKMAKQAKGNMAQIASYPASAIGNMASP